MLYAIVAQDAPRSLGARRAHRQAHRTRLEALLEAGRLVLAGPMPAVDQDEAGEAGYSGSLIVAEFDTLDDARAWADADPYVEAGVYAQVSVKPFRQVLP